MIKLQSIVEAIAAHPGVSAITTRVYGGRLPGGSEKFPCIVVSRAGGSAETEPPVDRALCDVKFYAASCAAAHALYEAVKSMTFGAPPAGFFSVNEITTGVDLSEDVTDNETYEYVWASFEFAI